MRVLAFLVFAQLKLQNFRFSNASKPSMRPLGYRLRSIGLLHVAHSFIIVASWLLFQNMKKFCVCERQR